MALHNDQRLLAGEKEVADKIKLLVEPLWKQHDTKEEQAVCLQEMGNIYLKASAQSKDGKEFTKASALFNAALVRTSNEDIQKKIKERLVVVRQDFMKTFYQDTEQIVLQQWEENKERNKQILEKMRRKIQDNSQSFKTLMNRYDIEANNAQEVEICLVNEAKKVTQMVQEEMLAFIRLLWNQSVETSKIKPQCKYSMMGLGSLARQEVTPYSDLEFAILVEEQSDDIQRYFENLTHFFHLSVLDLGESPIPMMAIASLNDFQTPEGDWFYDRITPSGFKLDGSMPWACKTPIGRQATSTKKPLSFIRTPVDMAELQKDDSVLGQSYLVSEVLGRTVHITGDFELYGIYQKEVTRITEETDKNIHDRKRIVGLWHDKIKHNVQKEPGDNPKLGHFRLPSTFVENLRLWLTPYFQGGSQWCIIENLMKIQKVSEKDALKLKVTIATAYGMRLFTYFLNRRQCEIYETTLFEDPGMKSIHKVKSTFPKLYYHIFRSNVGQSQMPKNLKNIQSQTRNMVIDQSLSIDTPQFDVNTIQNDNSWSPSDYKFYYIVPPHVLNVYYKLYFDSAVGALYMAGQDSFKITRDSGVYRFHCGESCLGKTVCELDCEDENLEKLEFLLRNTHLCNCVSMVQMYLEVHRYCVRKISNLPTGSPDIILNYMLDEISKCTEAKDRLYLHFYLLKPAYFSKNATILKRVSISLEKFLDSEVPKIFRKNHHKEIFFLMEFDFYQLLSNVYEFIGENEKLITLLQKWVNSLEKKCPSGEFDIEYIHVYTYLAIALLNKPEREEEAIYLFKKVLHRLESEINRGYSRFSGMMNYVKECAEDPEFDGFDKAWDELQNDEAFQKAIDVCYEDTLFKYVVLFVNDLMEKGRFEESEAIMIDYFFNDKKSIWFQNEERIQILCMLACCYRRSRKKTKWFETLEKIFYKVKYESVGKRLTADDRNRIAVCFNLMYLRNMRDLPKSAEFHRLACNLQEDKVLAVLEHRIFLLISSLWFFKLGLWYVGLHHVIGALNLGPKSEINFATTDVWLHILVVLCDSIDSIGSPLHISFLIENFERVASYLVQLSEKYNTSLDLYQTYVEYRLCYLLFCRAMNPDTAFALKTKETADYLYQTQRQLEISFPNCEIALKWCQVARVALCPKSKAISAEDSILPSSLLNFTQLHAQLSKPDLEKHYYL